MLRLGMNGLNLRMLSWVAVLTVYVHYLVTTVTPVNPGCDCVVYQSYGLSDGRFTSPNFPALYPPNTNCILYSFFGDSFEIIELTFFEFELRERDANGKCRDYVRIFQNLERPEVNENSQWDEELCGNYSSLPRKKFYSSDRSLILEFHSQGRVNTQYKGFRGVYQFLDKHDQSLG
ncbi:CUB domain-containing protein 2-like [Babylonia areolata]|uniref:CUB domain-containing protein 2-like n=1 Tax=Babylonia areolata TaxID=304850 RepID=UPI003FD69FBD